MNAEELNKLEEMPDHIALSGDMLANKSDRTLIYGYTTDRLDFHVYIKDAVIHRLVSDGGFLVSHDQEPSLMPGVCVPNKRIYPEHCDYEFCALLKKHQVHLPFTSFTQKQDNIDRVFACKILEELHDIRASIQVVRENLRANPLFTFADLDETGLVSHLHDPVQVVREINYGLTRTMISVVSNDLVSENSKIDKYANNVPGLLKHYITEHLANNFFTGTYEIPEAIQKFRKTAFMNRYTELMSLVAAQNSAFDDNSEPDIESERLAT